MHLPAGERPRTRLTSLAAAGACAWGTMALDDFYLSALLPPFKHKKGLQYYFLMSLSE